MSKVKELFDLLAEVSDEYFSDNKRKGVFSNWHSGMGSNNGVANSLVRAKKNLAMNLGIPMICQSRDRNRVNVYGVGYRVASINTDKFPELIQEMRRFSQSNENMG